LHEDLLNKHFDILFVFLKSQHPSASLVLKEFGDKNFMPSRMWRHGIHTFLEVLRQKYLETVEYILRFVSFAYSLITRLSESVSAFRDTWNEQLGDLARYRMTMELANREIWANVSKYWYNQVAYHSPNVGRVQHYLAVLSHPDVLQQLFYYTKALISVHPFTDGRENFNTLLSSYNGQSLHQHSTVTALLAAHGALFSHSSTEEFTTLANHFLSLLRKEISLPYRQGLQSVYMMSSNFASVLQYGALKTIIAVEFSQN
jgi:hypothetical protein